ncbi:uncharacterized protein LOC105688622 [Athalia rosae]|uniref:uncharacterized protein LOC105688622 n=1 Tax=Athalia rosae TaxID=37344 RepID=UPI0020335C1E|nr:uncharacterized protein LOC105688622 [Athalia rosae]
MSRNALIFNVAIIFILICVLDTGNSARILTIIPTASISHQVVPRALMLELNKRGHELVVITTDPVNNPNLTNYHEISAKKNYELMGEIDFLSLREIKWMDFAWPFVATIVLQQCDEMFAMPEVAKMMAPDSNEHFDLIFIEMLYFTPLLPLGKRFNAPVIGITSLTLPLVSQYAIGNPIATSHPSIWELQNGDYELQPPFWKRLKNFFHVGNYFYHYFNHILPLHQEAAKRYFGDDVPDLSELAKNVSLIFVNELLPISFVKANVPKMIEIGGFHVQPNSQKLSKDLKNILDQATEGFVYMSLGSNVKSRALPAATKNEFMAAFAKLPYKVLWKFEEDDLPGKPDNVIIMKWTPQQAILAHPNLKVFVYQGGLQSTEEAISNGVPLIGFPVFSDQEMLVNKMASIGAAIKLEITDVRSEKLIEAINTIVADNSYKKKMIEINSLIKDRPQDTMENAIWWTEYVIRHRGAPHLQSVTADYPWYMRHDMDIVAFCSVGSAIILLFALFVLYKSVSYSISLLRGNSVVTHEKKRSDPYRSPKMLHLYSFFITATFPILISLLHGGNGARILGVFPAISLSHQVVFRGLTLALNEKGHELVVVTTNPIKDPTLNNYKEIDIGYLYREKVDFDFLEVRPNEEWFDIFWWAFAPVMQNHTRAVLNDPEIKKLYAPDSNEKFDVVLMELLYWPALLTLAHRLNAPIIGITSLGLTVNYHHAIGNPILSTHPSNWQLRPEAIFVQQTFWQRIKRFVQSWKYVYYWKTEYVAKQQEIAEEFFGNDIPDIQDIEKNVSLIFVNQQTPISFARANVPKVIEIGGLHVSKKLPELPKDLQRILDNATRGFVYVSFGSNIKSSSLSAERINEFIAAFSKLPYEVLWKFEDDNLSGKPDNVITVKWAPQQAILAHPNLKLFIYQGGLQSTEEAVSCAVPLIGIPFFGDQDMQIDKMVSLDVAKKLEITTMRSEELVEAIRTITTDNGYKQRMLNLRSLTKDKPHGAMENAIWWTEFVIRHRGAPQLHSSMADEVWFRRYDMDLIAIFSAGSVIIIFATFFISFRIFLYIANLFTVTSVADKKMKLS